MLAAGSNAAGSLAPRDRGPFHGEYGAMRIGMKHPEVFGTLYLPSPCCVSAGSNTPTGPAAIAKLAAFKERPIDYRALSPVSWVQHASCASSRGAYVQ